MWPSHVYDPQHLAARKVLIVEDHEETGLLLRAYLGDELPRLVTTPEFGIPLNPKTGHVFADAYDEPGQGQLVHLNHALDWDRRFRAKPEADPSRLPEVELFSLKRLPALIAAAEEVVPASGHVEEDGTDSRVQDVVEIVGTPDILVVDLAMSEPQVRDMKAAKADVWFVEGITTDLGDPRPALRDLTGFKLLRIYAKAMGIPVIVTAYWPNPLVAHHCIVNGAFAFVRKPLIGLAAGVRDIATPDEPRWRELDLAAKVGVDARAVVIQRYLTDVSAEVLKAMTAAQLFKTD